MLNFFTLLAVFLPVPGAAVPVTPAPVPDSGRQVAEGTPATQPVRRTFVTIPAGEYVPFYGDGTPEQVKAFELDRTLITQHDYAEFLRTNPGWRRGAVKLAFADAGYLSGWTAPLAPADPAAPVVNVSWFAARAFCGATGGRLPTTAEWEYVAAASETLRDASRDKAFRALLLEMYTRRRPAQLGAAGSGLRNWYGIHDMHGIVREWVADFNTVMVSDDSRGAGASGGQLYCAAAASTARDPSDYAAFLRYSFRAGLTGRSTHGNLGFRCARSAP